MSNNEDEIFHMKTFLNTYKNKITILLLLAVFLNIVVIVIFDIPLKNENCKNGIVSFELAKDLKESKKIVESWDTKAKINAGLTLGFDYLFLLVYSSCLAMLIYNINNRLWENKSLYTIGQLLIIIIFVAACCDAVENFALIKLLLGDLKQLWSSVAYYFAIVKFTIVLICIIYLIINWGLLFFQRGSALND